MSNVTSVRVPTPRLASSRSSRNVSSFRPPPPPPPLPLGFRFFFVPPPSSLPTSAPGADEEACRKTRRSACGGAAADGRAGPAAMPRKASRPRQQGEDAAATATAVLVATKSSITVAVAAAAARVMPRVVVAEEAVADEATRPLEGMVGGGASPACVCRLRSEAMNGQPIRIMQQPA